MLKDFLTECEGIFYSQKENIYKALKLDTENKGLESLFEYCARMFSHLVLNVKSLRREVTSETIFGFFTSIGFNKLDVVSCNPEILDKVCDELAKSIKSVA